MAQPGARPPKPSESETRHKQKVRKVKTGCRTCKIRRVKCDEARPSCHRCLSTGRVCDGYGIWGGGGGGGGGPSSPRPSCDTGTATAVSTVVQNQYPSQKHREPILLHLDSIALRLLPLHVISADEHMCMEWFLHRTLGKLPGMFNSAFWKTLLPQASLSEPAVLHAVLSLGSVHRRKALDVGSAVDDNDTTESFTLQQYIRATSDLRRRMEHRSGHSTKVALIACAIFVHLEYMRGCHQTALTHLRHGLVLLEEMLDTNGRTEEGNRDVVDRWMMHAFTSLFVQAKLFGQDICQPRLLSRIGSHIEPVGETETFRSLNHARQSLEHLFLRIFDLKSQVRHTQCFESSSMPLTDTGATLQLELDSWLRAYEKAPGSPGMEIPDHHAVSSSAVERFAWRLLRVYHTLACVILSGCLSFATPATATATATTPSPDPSASSSSQPSTNSTSFSAGFSHSTESSAFSMSPPGEDTSSPPCPTRDSNSATNPSSYSYHPDDTTTTTTPFFRSILSQCEVLFKLALGPSIQSARPDRPAADHDHSNAIADIGWIPLLYHTAIHSPEPRIRCEAIRMLLLVPHREGIWDSLLAGAAAKKILDLEEAVAVATTATGTGTGQLCAPRPDCCRPRCEIAREAADLEFHHDLPVDVDLDLDLCPQPTALRHVQVELPEGPDGTLVLHYSMRSHHDRNGTRIWIKGRSSYHLQSGGWTDDDE
ncbi:hypothetical protein A1O3_06292 [Capronia epimyces CBS 606.96]|uniref:Zn(2)-C6 fungal-type domain-containing protein n=1 Tax=Capronia epimyces CBS 606.96 TaxID=1182542 RepID=W9YJN6_9EURO|nr:uncharacterized protein A1O3_06292 [Capronia epimyces CBS 606.96]EXJ82479.1 hypothetical protein A1O3_06292 [Capronia epimyces CBS 606.96]